MLNSSKIRIADFFLNWKSFLALNFLVFFAKIIFSIYNNFNADFFEDWGIARNLSIHGVYSWNLQFGSSVYKLPVYPVFLSFFIKCFGVINAVKYIIIVQHILYFLIPMVIIRIFENFNLKAAGFLAAYFFIFSPAYFYYSNILEATNLFILFFAIWIYFYSLFWVRMVNTIKIIIPFSIMTAIVALTQVVAIPIMGLLILLLLLYKKISFKNILYVTIIAVLGYSPWVIRNYVTFDRIIISKSPVWQNVFLGYVPDYQILSNNHFISEERKKIVFEKIAAHNEFVGEKIYEKEVRKIVETDRYAPLKKGLNNFISLWFVPKKYFNDNGLSILIGRKIYVLCLNFLLLISLIYFFRNNKKLFLFFCIVFVGFTFPYLIGHAANIRFKLDFEWIETSVISLFLFLKYLKTDKESNVNEKHIFLEK